MTRTHRIGLGCMLAVILIFLIVGAERLSLASWLFLGSVWGVGVMSFIFGKDR